MTSDLDSEPATRNELSGTVFGPSVQAVAIHGGVQIHEAVYAPPPVPRQLPPPPVTFVSRRAELAAMSAGSPLVVLSGQGGVGKTALALAWAHAVQDRYPDGQLFVDLDGFSGPAPVDPGEALGQFLRALGVPPQRVPATLAERAALYRSVAAGRSLLVVLDNAYSAAQVRVLLPVPPASTTVVTSRSRLIGLVPDGARLVEVALLPPADSMELLARTVGPDRIDRERAGAEQLAAICGGLPIALCVAAARLAGRPRLTLRRLVGALAEETGRLDALAVRDGPSVQATFDVSYRALQPIAAALYRRIALHPGPEFGVGPMRAVLAGEPAADSAAVPPAPAAVDELLDANLLEEVSEDRFRLHDLLRLHATRQVSGAERDITVRALAEWYFVAADRADRIVTPYRRRLPYEPLTPATELPTLYDRERALAWLERERVNLTAAGRAALEYGYAELAWHLADVMWPLFLYHKHFPDRIETDLRGVAAARAWGNGWAEADMLKRLSGPVAAAGDVDAAERHIRRAISLCARIGDARGEADAREALARLVNDHRGRPAEAAEMLTDVFAANRKLADPRCTGLTLINLGMVLPRLGRAGEAQCLLEEARELFAGLSRIDPYNEVRALVSLAGAYLGAEDLRRAEDTAAEAVRRMRDLGAEHGQAEALDVLGQIAERRGDAVKAGRIYRLALDTFTALGSRHAAAVRARLAALGRPAAQILHHGQQGGPVPEPGRDGAVR